MAIKPKANLQLIYVTDIARSTLFYQDIFQAQPLFSSPRYVAFAADSLGESLFAIWTGGAKPDVNAPRFAEIGIMLGSNAQVDELFDEWKKNLVIKFVREPYDEVFGRTFLAQDPDGHIIRVCSRD